MGSLWNRSGVVERYADDLRAAGALAYFFAGGTTTPFTVYRDAGGSSAHTHPVVADADGRWPDVFVPYTPAYDVQVKTADGVQLTYSLLIPNPNPVDVTVTIPAEEKIQTGMIHAEMVNSTKAGYVRLNGRSISSAAGSGTERNNIDCLALYTYLWNNLDNTICPVSGGRGASAGADFSPGNKTLTLPDMRGAAFVGLDDMGNSAASFFSGITFAAGNTITAGSYTGANGVTLGLTNMPAHQHTGTTSAAGGHSHALAGTATGTAAAETAAHSHAYAGTAGPSGGITATTAMSGVNQDHTHSIGTGAGMGGALKQNALGQGVATVGGVHTLGDATATITVTSTQSLDHVHTITGITAGQSATHTHTVSITTWTSASATQGATEALGADHTHTMTTSVAGGTAGVTQPFNNLGLTRLVTWFIKL